MGMLAVLRIRGRVGVKPDVRKTLELLKLNRKHTLAVVPDTPAFRGMIQKVKDYVTWGEIDEETLELLRQKRKEYKANSIVYFRLAPPKGGFKGSIKKPLPYGELGYRSKAINELIRRCLHD